MERVFMVRLWHVDEETNKHHAHDQGTGYLDCHQVMFC